jgi:hypothetical protein
LRAVIAVLEEYGYNSRYFIKIFKQDLWKQPVEDAAQEDYQSLLLFCERDGSPLVDDGLFSLPLAAQLDLFPAHGDA